MAGGINYTGGARNAHKRSKTDTSLSNQKSYFATHAQAARIAGTGTRYKDAERAPAMVAPAWASARARDGKVVRRRERSPDASGEGSGHDSEPEGTKLMRQLERRALDSQREKHLLAMTLSPTPPNVPSVRAALLDAPNWAGTATLPKRPHSPPPHDSHDLEPIRSKKKRKKHKKKQPSPPTSSDPATAAQVAVAASKWTPAVTWKPAATTGTALLKSALKKSTPISFTLPSRPPVGLTASAKGLLPSPVFAPKAAPVLAKITTIDPESYDLPSRLTGPRSMSNSPGKRAREDRDERPRRSTWDDEALDSEWGLAGDRSPPQTNSSDFESLGGFSQIANDQESDRSVKRQRGLEGFAASSQFDATLFTSTLDLVATSSSIQLQNVFEIQPTERQGDDGPPTAAVEQSPAAPEAHKSPQEPLPELVLPRDTEAVENLPNLPDDGEVPAVAHFKALADAHTPPIVLSPAFFAPMAATWRGPSCVKKQQRVALERIWEWDESEFPEDDAAKDALVLVEGMGLGCRGLTKAELREKRAREWDLQCAWEASEAARRSQEADHAPPPHVPSISEAAPPDKDDPPLQPELAAPAPPAKRPTPLFEPIPPTPTPSPAHSKTCDTPHLLSEHQHTDSPLIITCVARHADLSTLSQIGAVGSSSQEAPEFEFVEDSEDEYVARLPQVELEAKDTAPVEAVAAESRPEGVGEKTLNEALQAVSEMWASRELDFGDMAGSSFLGLSDLANEAEQRDGADGELESAPRGVVQHKLGAFWGDDDMEGIAE